MAEIYNSIANTAEQKRESFKDQNSLLIRKFERDYRNIKLEEMVKKDFEKNKILYYRNSLVQNVYPIYLDPSPGKALSFRTHFLAPSKYFMGRKIDTFAFNISLVLFSTIILYLLLYYEAGAMIAGWFERMQFQKKGT
jgi:hypothetical protein